jgi:hypothetical protein
LLWPHDVESFQSSTFCLFVMVQPWNIGVCWIDQVFVGYSTLNVSIYSENKRGIYFSPQKRLKHGRQNITLHINFIFATMYIYCIYRPILLTDIFICRQWNLWEAKDSLFYLCLKLVQIIFLFSDNVYDFSGDRHRLYR